ncbi:hypothetical protein HanPSC8_Chr06g0243031 [Helianthus annuus]|nr:hypothetical protein HanPSC8_Chr06g0243031 [Helianthus annuus]
MSVIFLKISSQWTLHQLMVLKLQKLKLYLSRTSQQWLKPLLQRSLKRERKN